MTTLALNGSSEGARPVAVHPPGRIDFQTTFETVAGWFVGARVSDTTRVVALVGIGAIVVIVALLVAHDPLRGERAPLSSGPGSRSHLWILAVFAVAYLGRGHLLEGAARPDHPIRQETSSRRCSSRSPSSLRCCSSKSCPPACPSPPCASSSPSWSWPGCGRGESGSPVSATSRRGTSSRARQQRRRQDRSKRRSPDCPKVTSSSRTGPIVSTCRPGVRRSCCPPGNSRSPSRATRTSRTRWASSGGCSPSTTARWRTTGSTPGRTSRHLPSSGGGSRSCGSNSFRTGRSGASRISRSSPSD